MKTRAKQPSRAPVKSRDAIAVAVATILAGAASQAGAQAAAAGDGIEEIVVTGIRASIEHSIEAKRENDQIIEVVSAEDIGKLPDTSIADSIARLPGLAAQRIDGRPSEISIRGLGPDYSTGLLNGRQVVSTSDTRAVDYDQFPSELVNQVVVYKTNDAGVVGQGLAGTIDIRPIAPLEAGKRTLAFGLRGEVNSNGKVTSTGKGDKGDRFSAAYVDQFADNTIGLALGFAHLDSPGQAKHYEAWKYGDYIGQWGANPSGVPSLTTPGTNCVVDPNRPQPPLPPIVQQCAQTSQGFTANTTSSKQVRDGAIAVLEFKPNDHYTSTVDLYYSKFTQDRIEDFWTGDIGLWAGPPAAFTNVGTTVLNGNTIVSSGSVANGHNLVYLKNFDRTDKITSVGWRNELQFNDNWKGMADVGYSKASRDEYYVQSVARAVPDSSFTFSHLDTVDHAVWTTPQDLTNSSTVLLTNDPGWAELKTPHYSDAIKSIKLSATRKFGGGLFSDVSFGLAYNQRDKDVTSAEYQLNLAGDGSARVPIPASALRAPVNISVDGINQSVLTWDVPSIMGLYTAVSKNPWDAKDNRYAVHEKVTTGFVKLDIDSSLGSVPVKGNVGVQVVRSDQKSDGFAWNDGGTSGGPSNGAIIPVHGGLTYTDVLPSLNLVFSLQPDLKLRAGVGKTMARPRMDDMRAGADQPRLDPITGSTTLGKWTSNGGGNPKLLPWRAWAYDLTLEKYFGKRSYIAVAGFLKNLQSFIYTQTVPRDYTGFPNYSLTLVPGCGPSEPNCNPNLGTISAAANGTGGRVYGAEFSASLDGSLISPALDGIGLILSESNTRNSLPKDNNKNTIYLDGFSGTVNSIAVYYEKGGFSARVSQRYRSAFTATTRGILLSNETNTHIDAEKQVDGQVGYSFEEGGLKGLSILLQGNNLTNQPAIQRFSPEVTGDLGNSKGLLPWKYDDYGRTILIGVTYKL